MTLAAREARIKMAEAVRPHRAPRRSVPGLQGLDHRPDQEAVATALQRALPLLRPQGMVTVPATDLVDAHDRTAADLLVVTLYCPGCDGYSGGGLCRRCESGQADFAAPTGTFAAIVCSRGQGCEVVTLPAAASAEEAESMRQETLL